MAINCKQCDEPLGGLSEPYETVSGLFCTQSCADQYELEHGTHIDHKTSDVGKYALICRNKLVKVMKDVALANPMFGYRVFGCVSKALDRLDPETPNCVTEFSMADKEEAAAYREIIYFMLKSLP